MIISFWILEDWILVIRELKHGNAAKDLKLNDIENGSDKYYEINMKEVSKLYNS